VFSFLLASSAATNKLPLPTSKSSKLKKKTFKNYFTFYILFTLSDHRLNFFTVRCYAQQHAMCAVLSLIKKFIGLHSIN